MAKSTASAALASLQHKYRAKIKEVGSLRRILAELTTNSTTPDEDTNRKLYDVERAKKQQFAGKAATALTEIQRLQRIANERQDYIDSLVNQASVNATVLASRERQLADTTTQLRNSLRANSDLKDSASNWKSLSAILFITGIAIGGLSYMAYIAQTAGL